MFKGIYIDTGAFIGAELGRDQYHGRAVQGWTELSESSAKLYSSEHVLNETLLLLARAHSGAFAAERGKTYLASPEITWLNTGSAILQQACSFLEKYGDQRLSFTDGISFALMKREKIKWVFGFDRHFHLAGFHLWSGG